MIAEAIGEECLFSFPTHSIKEPKGKGDFPPQIPLMSLASPINQVLDVGTFKPRYFQWLKATPSHFPCCDPRDKAELGLVGQGLALPARSNHWH